MTFENLHDDSQAMFSIQKNGIPNTRLNGKGKQGDNFPIHTVLIAYMDYCVLMGLDRFSWKCSNYCVSWQVVITLGPRIGTWRYILSHFNKSDWLYSCIEIELPSKDDIIQKVFIDPTSNHVIITTSQERCYYLHSSKSKVVQLKSISKYNIESVAWNRLEGNINSTGVCLEDSSSYE